MSGIFDSLFFPVGDGGGGGSAAVNGTLRSYQVNEGAEVEAGDFVEFVHKHGAGEIEADTTSRVCARLMPNNRVAVLYYVNTTYKIVILSFNGNSLVTGESYTLPTASYAAMDILSENELFVSYTVNSTGIYSTVLSVNGTAITEKIAPTLCENAYTYSALTCDKIADGKIVLHFVDNKNNYTGVSYLRIEVTNSAISYGTITQIFRGSSSWDSSGYGYSYGLNSNIFSTKIADGIIACSVSYTYRYKSQYVSAGASSSGSEYYTKIEITKFADGSYTTKTNTVLSSGDESIVIAPINDTRIGFASSSKVYTCDLSGVTLSIGGQLSASSTINTLGKSAMMRVSENKIAFCTKSTFRVYNVTSSTPALLYSATIPMTGTTDHVSIVPYSETSGLIVREGSTCSFMVYELTDTGVTFISNTNTTNGTFVKPATSSLYNVGVAKSAGTAGQTIQVYCAT